MTQSKPQAQTKLPDHLQDYEVYLQFIPEQWCSMCDRPTDIVANDEAESKERYPWFCEECEDATEIINLRSSFITDLTLQAQAHAESQAKLQNEVLGKAYNRIIELEKYGTVSMVDVAKVLLVDMDTTPPLTQEQQWKLDWQQDQIETLSTETWEEFLAKKQALSKGNDKEEL